RNIVPSPNIPRDALAKIEATLSSGGAVLKTKLLKRSGHRVYDSAVERTMKRSEPLRSPSDATLFNPVRVLHLVFSPINAPRTLTFEQVNPQPSKVQQEPIKEPVANQEMARLATTQKGAEAQYNLGERYYFGQGVTQDDVEAVKWYRLAA